MVLSFIDWLIVGLYFAFTLGIALYYTKRAGASTKEFFLSGQNMPWWLAGTSMVATTFAADTPLAVTELVASRGIAGNWLWWNMVAGGILTVFFFARLWRRSGVLTDVEFVEIRYTGKAAAFLRGLKAVHFGMLMNAVIIGWVILAMETVLNVLFSGMTLFGQTEFNVLGKMVSPAFMVVSFLTLLVAVFSLMSGLWGVVITDMFQFIIAMVGTFILAVMVLQVPEVGGLAGLRAQLPDSTFNLLPSFGESATTVGMFVLTPLAFIAHVGIQWWSSWYPGSEPGGGGYIAQRMLSAKDERNALFATLWFTIAHYCLRPWPWIIVALSSLVLFPDLAIQREGFVLVMRDVLPAGLIGLLFAAFLAAFMSTLSTQLNWGVSYLVNDLYRRFIRPEGSEKDYVLVSRILTFLLSLFAIFVASRLDTIAGAWELLITASAGLGLVLILRWYWWRINAWSELTATLVPVGLALLAWILPFFGLSLPGFSTFPNNLFMVVAVTTVAWVAVTYLTAPTDERTLTAFYTRIRPAGPGWAPFRARYPELKSTENLGFMATNWLMGVTLVYATLFASGSLLFGNRLVGTGLVVVALGMGALLWKRLSTDSESRV